MAEDGHPGRVAAERDDLFLDPTQDGYLVEQCAVGRRTIEFGVALDADAVVGGHHDNPVPGQPGAVEEVRVRGAEAIGAAVHPHHHR